MQIALWVVAIGLTLLSAVETATALTAHLRVASEADWNDAADEVRDGFQPGDLIVFAPAWVDPVGRSHLGDLVSPKERGRYYGYFSVTYTTAGGLGPLLGGLIADHLNWSVIFWMNIPMGLAALAITSALLRRLPRHERPQVGNAAGTACVIRV